MAHLPPNPSNTFMAGDYQFTRFEAKQCARLYRSGIRVRQIKQMYHQQASLKQIVVAIQVGIMIKYDSFWLEQLNPAIFDPRLVALGMWKLGEPNQIPSLADYWLARGQGRERSANYRD